MLRTYARRGSAKRKPVGRPASTGSDDDELTFETKRRKVEPEATRNERTPSPTRTVSSSPAPSSPLHIISATELIHSARATSKSPTKPSPGRPREPTCDLSQMFEETVPAPPPAAPKGKIARRMLARSRTESSIISISSGSASAGGSFEKSAPPKPTTSSKPKTTRSLSRSPSFGNASAAGPSAPPIIHGAAAPKRTYGGNSRSFLVPMSALPLPGPTAGAFKDADFDAIMGDTMPLDPEAEETRESYTSLRERWGVDVSSDDPHGLEEEVLDEEEEEEIITSPLHPSIALPSRRPTALSRNESSRGTNASRFRATAVAPSLPAGMMNDLKSITELRSKGQSRRFLDEVGYLFEGMEKGGNLGLRRASALEIVTKLSDPDFARRAKAADFLTRAWTVLREAGAGDGDKVLDIIIAFFAALVARDASSISDLAKSTELVNVLFTLVDTPDFSAHSRTHSGVQEKDMLALFSSGPTDLDLKKAGVLRTEKPVLTNLHNIVKKSEVFCDSTRLSTRLLVSQTLAALSPSLIVRDKWPILQKTLSRDLSLVPTRIKAYVSGMSLIPSSPSSEASSILDTPSWQHIENCLRLVDSYLLGHWARGEVAAEETELDAELLDGLISLGLAVEILLRNEPDKKTLETADKCTEMTYRVLISLSHENAQWSRAVLHHTHSIPWMLRTISKSHLHFASSQLASTTSDVALDAQFLDKLCLALGLLTNLVQMTDEAKNIFRETRIDITCTAKRLCIRGCKCPSRITGIECLALVYLQPEINTNDPAADFVRGHLAILFGLLIVEML